MLYGGVALTAIFAGSYLVLRRANCFAPEINSPLRQYYALFRDFRVAGCISFAALTRRMYRRPIPCQRGKENGTFARNPGRVDM